MYGQLLMLNISFLMHILFCYFTLSLVLPVCGEDAMGQAPFSLLLPVQLIVWKDSSLKWRVMCWVGCKTILTYLPKIRYTLPIFMRFGPYLGISCQKNPPKSPQAIFLKFTKLMCSYSPHICIKFRDIRFINQGFTTEKLLGHFCPKHWAPSPETRGRIPQQLSVEKWYGGPLSTCQVWWRSVYPRWHKTKKSFFCLSRWAWSRRPTMMFGIYRAIFMGFRAFLQETASNCLHHFELNC